MEEAVPQGNAPELDRFENFVELINALHKEIERIKAAEAARLGFKGGDVMCLYYLAKHPEGLTASELARKTDVSRAAMSRTVTRLADEGLVEIGDGTADAMSRYRAPVRLTESGKEAAAPIEDIARSVLDETGAVLTEESRMQMYDTLGRVLTVLQNFD